MRNRRRRREKTESPIIEKQTSYSRKRQQHRVSSLQHSQARDPAGRLSYGYYSRRQRCHLFSYKLRWHTPRWVCVSWSQKYIVNTLQFPKYVMTRIQIVTFPAACITGTPKVADLAQILVEVRGLLATSSHAERRGRNDCSTTVVSLRGIVYIKCTCIHLRAYTYIRLWSS